MSCCWAHWGPFFDHRRKPQRWEVSTEIPELPVLTCYPLSPVSTKPICNPNIHQFLVSFDHKFFKVTTLSFVGIASHAESCAKGWYTVLGLGKEASEQLHQLQIEQTILHPHPHVPKQQDSKASELLARPRKDCSMPQGKLDFTIVLQSFI